MGWEFAGFFTCADAEVMNAALERWLGPYLNYEPANPSQPEPALNVT